MNFKWIVCVPLLLLLAACQEEVKPIEWWMEHSEEREEKLEECKTDEVSLNCENARQAAFNIRATGGNRETRERPTIRLTQ